MKSAFVAAFGAFVSTVKSNRLERAKRICERNGFQVNKETKQPVKPAKQAK